MAKKPFRAAGNILADIFVTDVVMPGGVDGWQVAEQCRAHHPNLAVIYVTGFSPVKARPVSGSLIVSKPYRPGEVVLAVRRLTEKPAA